MTPLDDTGKNSQPVSTTERLKPLTNPADIMTLLGRFGACIVLMGMTIAYLFKGKQYVVFGLILAVISLVCNLATAKLWRRLRDERIAAEAERSGAARPENQIIEASK